MCQDPNKIAHSTKNHIPSVWTTWPTTSNRRHRCRNKIKPKNSDGEISQISIINVDYRRKRDEKPRIISKRMAGLWYHSNASQTDSSFDRMPSHLQNLVHSHTISLEWIISFGNLCWISFVSSTDNHLDFLLFFSVRTCIEINASFFICANDFVPLTIWTFCFYDCNLAIPASQFFFYSLLKCWLLFIWRSRVLKSSRWHSNN